MENIKEVNDRASLSVWGGGTIASLSGDDVRDLKVGEDVLIDGDRFIFRKWGMPSSGFKVFYYDKQEKIEITVDEYDELKNKARKWDEYTSKLAKNLPNKKLNAKQRSEAARKAVQARWAKK